MQSTHILSTQLQDFFVVNKLNNLVLISTQPEKQNIRKSPETPVFSPRTKTTTILPPVAVDRSLDIRFVPFSSASTLLSVADYMGSASPSLGSH